MGLPWEINMNAHNHHLFVKPMLVLKTLQMTTKPCRKSPFRVDLIVTGVTPGKKQRLRFVRHLLTPFFLPLVVLIFPPFSKEQEGFQQCGFPSATRKERISPVVPHQGISSA